MIKPSRKQPKVKNLQVTPTENRAEDSEDEGGFSKWLKSDEGVELIKFFVLGNAIVIFLTITWPSVQEVFDSVSRLLGGWFVGRNVFYYFQRVSVCRGYNYIYYRHLEFNKYLFSGGISKIFVAAEYDCRYKKNKFQESGLQQATFYTFCIRWLSILSYL